MGNLVTKTERFIERMITTDLHVLKCEGPAGDGPNVGVAIDGSWYRYKWEGDVRDGKPNGMGVKTYLDEGYEGKKEYGEFKDGYPCGLIIEWDKDAIECRDDLDEDDVNGDWDIPVVEVYHCENGWTTKRDVYDSTYHPHKALMEKVQKVAAAARKVATAGKKKGAKRKADLNEHNSKPTKKTTMKVNTTMKASSGPLNPGEDTIVGNYTVRRAYSGFYTCDCPRYKFQKGKLANKVCKHITSLGVSLADQKAGSSVPDKLPPFQLKKRKTMTQDEKNEYSSKSIPELKEMLRNNSQLVGGTKKELISRIVYCIEYGCLPRCQKCGGGRLKKNGRSFKCPGFMDDDEFQYCGFTSNGSDLTFPEWR
eukprot:m.68978 g.68978  ORF g.68978 m.68978 type:complete len:366 (+) comp12016_c0_seq1:233-1330(+)